MPSSVIENVSFPIPSEVIMGLGVSPWRAARGILAADGVGTIGSERWETTSGSSGRQARLRTLKPIADRWGRWLTLEWEDIGRPAGSFPNRPSG